MRKDANAAAVYEPIQGSPICREASSLRHTVPQVHWIMALLLLLVEVVTENGVCQTCQTGSPACFFSPREG